MKSNIIENGNQKSGIKLIAELANVSIGTVDRVLHNRPGVAEETKKRILKIIKNLNYQPNIIARRLVSKKKYSFSALIPIATKENPYWILHERGIQKAEKEIQQLGIFVKRYYFDQNGPKSYAKKIKEIIGSKDDGVILVPFFSNETAKLLKHCTDNNIPYVFFDTNLRKKGNNPLSFIGQDSFHSGYFAGELISYMLSEKETALIVSINAVKKADNHINYLQREEGIKKFVDETRSFNLQFLHYNKSSDKNESRSLEKKILNALSQFPSIKVIFVTNSRAYKVAEILEKNNIINLCILGYDLIEANIEYLKKGYIDFLISQEPFNQGYTSVISLYSHLILNQNIDPNILMPITLINKENLEFYKG